VRENIQLYGGIYDLEPAKIRDRTKRILDRLRLAHAERELVRALPLGWKQKLAFSVALLHEPQIVFLDEPTSGVDPITRRQFWEMIYEAAHGGTTVLVTTHYMDEAEYCDPSRSWSPAGSTPWERRPSSRRVKVCRRSTSCSSGWLAPPRARRGERALGAAAQGVLPHPARPAHARRADLHADRAGGPVRLLHSHRRHRRAAGDRRPDARRNDARPARPVQRRRRVPHRGRIADGRGARPAVRARHGA